METTIRDDAPEGAINTLQRRKGQRVTQRNFQLLKRHCEKTEGPSETVPNETPSIREILARHIRGQRIGDENFRSTGNDPEATFDSDDLEAISRSDFADKHEHLQNFKERVKKSREKLSFLESEKKKRASELRGGEGAEEASKERKTSDDTAAHTHTRSQKYKASDKPNKDDKRSGKDDAGRKASSDFGDVD